MASIWCWNKNQRTVIPFLTSFHLYLPRRSQDHQENQQMSHEKGRKMEQNHRKIDCKGLRNSSMQLSSDRKLRLGCRKIHQFPEMSPSNRRRLIQFHANSPSTDNFFMLNAVGYVSIFNDPFSWIYTIETYFIPFFPIFFSTFKEWWLNWMKNWTTSLMFRNKVSPEKFIFNVNRLMKMAIETNSIWGEF